MFSNPSISSLPPPSLSLFSIVSRCDRSILYSYPPQQSSANFDFVLFSPALFSLSPRPTTRPRILTNQPQQKGGLSNYTTALQKFSPSPLSPFRLTPQFTRFPPVRSRSSRNPLSSRYPPRSSRRQVCESFAWFLYLSPPQRQQQHSDTHAHTTPPSPVPLSSECAPHVTGRTLSSFLSDGAELGRFSLTSLVLLSFIL